MLNIKRGSLVHSLFPNQEGKGFSTKLCIVLDSEGNCAYLVPCTSSIDQEYRYSKYILIKENSPEGVLMNLKNDTMIIIDRFDPMPFNIIKREHNGITPESLLERIEIMLEDI